MSPSLGPSGPVTASTAPTFERSFDECFRLLARRKPIGERAPAGADASESDVGAPIAKEIATDIGAPEPMTVEARASEASSKMASSSNSRVLRDNMRSEAERAKRAQTAKKIRRRTRIG